MTWAVDPRDGRAEQHGWMTIGEVLTRLRPDFPDVTISKIRFLEDQGLVEPARSAAGYRKFAPDDVERLRFVLGRQRDQYLPLRVIREQLAELDRGASADVEGVEGDRGAVVATEREFPASGSVAGSVVGSVAGSDAARRGDAARIRPATLIGRGPLRHTRADLVRLSGAQEAQVAELDDFGLLGAPGPDGRYGEEAVVIVAAAARLAEHGIEPRHLRAFRGAADREAGLVEQVVAPMRRRGDDAVDEHCEQVAAEVLAACLRMHSALVAAALRRRG